MCLFYYKKGQSFSECHVDEEEITITRDGTLTLLDIGEYLWVKIF